MSGQSWEALVKERIFDPLHMTASNFSVADTEASADFARPYSIREGKLKRVPMRPVLAMGPAGAVNSNVLDMAKWLQFNLDNQEKLAVVHTPQMTLPTKSPPFAEFSYPAYALGWVRQAYRGHELIWHTGGIDGFLTFAGFMPDQNLGVVVFQNADNAQVMNPLAFRAIDDVLGAPATDWYERVRAAKPAPAPQKQYEHGPLPRPFADYVATYNHPMYGDVTVREGHAGPELEFHQMVFTMEHLNNGLFKLHSGQFKDVEEFDPVYFQTNGAGGVADLLIKLEPAVEPIAFKRVTKAMMPN